MGLKIGFWKVIKIGAFHNIRIMLKLLLVLDYLWVVYMLCMLIMSVHCNF